MRARLLLHVATDLRHFYCFPEFLPFLPPPSHQGLRRHRYESRQEPRGGERQRPVEVSGPERAEGGVPVTVSDAIGGAGQTGEVPPPEPVLGHPLRPLHQGGAVDFRHESCQVAPLEEWQNFTFKAFFI